MNKTTETSFCSRPAALFACGRQSIRLPVPVYIRSSASVVGSREKQGPLGSCLTLQEKTTCLAAIPGRMRKAVCSATPCIWRSKKAGLHSTDIRYLFAGDLLGQSIATSFGLMQYERPLFGLYGACSTCGLSLTLAEPRRFPAALRILPPASQAAISPAQKRNSVFRLRQSAAAFRLLDCDRKRCVHPRKRSIWA